VLDAANLFASGRFNTGEPATWAEGDFNYDGIVDVLDIADVMALGLYDAGGYNTPPGVVTAVPEPSPWTVIWGVALGVASWSASRAARRKVCHAGFDRGANQG
jgi:hypothetical protein